MSPASLLLWESCPQASGSEPLRRTCKISHAVANSTSRLAFFTGRLGQNGLTDGASTGSWSQDEKLTACVGGGESSNWETVEVGRGYSQ